MAGGRPLPAPESGIPPEIARIEAARRQARWEAERRQQRPKRRSSTWLILGLIFGIPALVLAFIIGASVLYELAAEDLPVTDADRLVLVEAGEVALDTSRIDPSYAETSKRRYIDDTHELEYVYDDAASTFLTCTVAVTTDRNSAADSYSGYKSALLLTLSLFGVDARENPDFVSWGEESYCAILRQGSRTAGHVFLGRKGRRVFYLLLIGLPLNDDEAFLSLVESRLEAVETYDP